MPNSLANFTPEKWSTALNMKLRKNTKMKDLVSTKYSGEIKNHGDTVHIRSIGSISMKNYSDTIVYENLTDPMQTLLIDRKKYFAFKVDDINKAQNDINVMNEYLVEAKIAAVEEQDSFLLAKYADVPAGNQVAGGAFTKDNIYSKVCAVAEKLKLSNAIRSGDKKGWLVINPTIETIMIQAPEFIQATQLGMKTIEEGHLGRMAGLDIYSSTNLAAVSGVTYCLAGTKDAITFAGQVTKIQPVILEGEFAEAMRGLYVYGGKVIVPEALAYLSYTPQ